MTKNFGNQIKVYSKYEIFRWNFISKIKASRNANRTSPQFCGRKVCKLNDLAEETL